MHAPQVHALRLLILQPTPFCNIGCDYCYLPERANKAQMSLQVVEAAIANVLRSGLVAEELSIVWHAGEPLVMPPAFYQQSFATIRQRLAGVARASHSVQTNGLLIDDAWCELFAQWNVRVGVSLDGPAYIHDRHRKTRDGRPTHARVMQAIACLQNNHIPLHVIAVVTRDSLQHAEDIVEFFWRNGITEIGFNIDEREGVNTACSLDGLEAEYVDFMRGVLTAARHAPAELHIREIHNAARAIRHGIPQVRLGQQMIPYNPQVIAGQIISVDWRGGFSTFSPELLDQHHAHYGSFVLGNVLTDSIAVALRSAKARRIQEDIAKGIEACRHSCEFFQHCGGGAPVNKLSENGSFESTSTVYCRCAIQAPFRATLESLEAALRLQRQRNSGNVGPNGNSKRRGRL